MLPVSVNKAMGKPLSPTEAERAKRAKAAEPRGFVAASIKIQSAREKFAEDLQDACESVLDRALPAISDARHLSIAKLSELQMSFRVRCREEAPEFFPRLIIHQEAVEACLLQELTRISDGAASLFSSFADLIAKRHRESIDEFAKLLREQVEYVRDDGAAKLATARAALADQVNSAVLEERQRSAELLGKQLRTVQHELETTKETLGGNLAKTTEEFTALREEYMSILRYTQQMKDTLKIVGKALSVDVGRVIERRKDGKGKAQHGTEDVAALLKARAADLGKVEDLVRSLRKQLLDSQEHASGLADELHQTEMKLREESSLRGQAEAQVKYMRERAASKTDAASQAESMLTEAQDSLRESQQEVKELKKQQRAMHRQLLEAEGKAKRFSADFDVAVKEEKERVTVLEASLQLAKEQLKRREDNEAAKLAAESRAAAMQTAATRAIEEASLTRREFDKKLDALKKPGAAVYVFGGAGGQSHLKRRMSCPPRFDTPVPCGKWQFLVDTFADPGSVNDEAKDAADADSDPDEPLPEFASADELQALQKHSGKKGLFTEIISARKRAFIAERQVEKQSKKLSASTARISASEEALRVANLQLLERDILLKQMTQLMQDYRRRCELLETEGDDELRSGRAGQAGRGHVPEVDQLSRGGWGSESVQATTYDTDFPFAYGTAEAVTTPGSLTAAGGISPGSKSRGSNGFFGDKSHTGRPLRSVHHSEGGQMQVPRVASRLDQPPPAVKIGFWESQWSAKAHSALTSPHPSVPETARSLASAPGGLGRERWSRPSDGTIAGVRPQSGQSRDFRVPIPGGGATVLSAQHPGQRYWDGGSTAGTCGPRGPRALAGSGSQQPSGATYRQGYQDFVDSMPPPSPANVRAVGGHVSHEGGAGAEPRNTTAASGRGSHVRAVQSMAGRRKGSFASLEASGDTSGRPEQDAGSCTAASATQPAAGSGIGSGSGSRNRVGSSVSENFSLPSPTSGLVVDMSAFGNQRSVEGRQDGPVTPSAQGGARDRSGSLASDRAIVARAGSSHRLLAGTSDPDQGSSLSQPKLPPNPMPEKVSLESCGLFDESVVPSRAISPKRWSQDLSGFQLPPTLDVHPEELSTQNVVKPSQRSRRSPPTSSASGRTLPRGKPPTPSARGPGRRQRPSSGPPTRTALRTPSSRSGVTRPKSGGPRSTNGPSRSVRGGGVGAGHSITRPGSAASQPRRAGALSSTPSSASPPRRAAQPHSAPSSRSGSPVHRVSMVSYSDEPQQVWGQPTPHSPIHAELLDHLMSAPSEELSDELRPPRAKPSGIVVGRTKYAVSSY